MKQELVISTPLEPLKRWHEELLEKQKPMPMNAEQDAKGFYATCGRCGARIVTMLAVDKFDIWTPKFCPDCGQRVKRWDGDE